MIKFENNSGQYSHDRDQKDRVAHGGAVVRAADVNSWC